MKRIGKALEKAIKDGDEDDTHVRTSLLMHPVRRRIFRYLSFHPCASISKIAREVGVSNTDAQWHLNKLLEVGYISRQRVGNKVVFYPSAMVEREDVPLLHILTNQHLIDVLSFISSNPGSTQKEICEYMGNGKKITANALKKLSEYGLVAVIKDGTLRRYYPTSLLKEKADAYHRRAKHIASTLLKHLRQDVISSDLVHSSGYEITIRLRMGKEYATLNLNINPFAGRV